MMPNASWTDPQRKLLFSLLANEHRTKEEIEAALTFPLSDLHVREASLLIDCLKSNGDMPATLKQVREMHAESPYTTEISGGNDNMPNLSPTMPKTREEAAARKAEAEHAKNDFVVAPGSELALARTAGIPEEMANLFFMRLNGNAYIKVAGLQYMAGKIGYRRIEITDEEKSGTWKAEAKVYPKIDVKTLEALAKLAPETQKEAYADLAKPTNGFGTANKENVQNPRMHAFLREMAQTRALGRALRSYTGYGSTTYEELPDAEIERD